MRETRGRRTEPRGRAHPDGQRPDKHRATVDSNTLEEQCHARKIFIGGLAHKTTTQHLRDHFGGFGAIVDAVVLRWPDGRSRGFGYVTYADAMAASAALQEQHTLSGREVDVKRAVPGTNKLFVGGLPQHANANELREHFEKFGVVSDAVVMIDPATSRSRGFGFVCFLPGQEGAAAATSALEQHDSHRIRGKWIDVKSAAPPHKLGGTGGKEEKSSTPSMLPDGTISLSAACTTAASDDERSELSLAAAVSGTSRPDPSPSPSVENREPERRVHDVPPSLGSPRKVMLSECDGFPVQSPPPGLGAPSLPNTAWRRPDFEGSMAAGLPSPWWAAQPWPPFFPRGLGPAPGFNGLDTAPMAGIGMEDFRNPFHPAGLGLSGAEGLQRNLEQFLRQSTESKLEHRMASDTPSVSTACSSFTQTDYL